ncbi:MAG: hypothetical protein AAFV95_28015 [Bacteroidota bacterium]
MSNERKTFMQSINLPNGIKNLMRLGLWVAKEDCPLNDELAKEFNWGDKVTLVNNLHKEDAGLSTTSRTNDIQHIYGTYKTGERTDDESLDWIDVNKAILIAVNHDEEAICLDYRFSKTHPRILATYFEKMPRQYSRWKEIAKEEDELIRKLGIQA